MKRRPSRIGIAVYALRIHVDQAHVDGRKRVFQRRGVIEVAIAVFGRRKPFLLGPPVHVRLRAPNILAAKAESKALQAHRFIGNRARQDDQISPGKRISVFLLDGPKQSAGLVETCIVGPGVKRRKSDVAGTAAAAAVLQPVGPGRMPGEADHQTAVVAPIRWPPILAVGHHGMDIGFDGFVVETFHRLTMVVIGVHRIGARAMLVKDVQVQRFRPPFGDRLI